MKGPTATRFTVEGVNPTSFPLDMLRYDACFPFDQESVAAISRSFDASQRVEAHRERKPITVTLMMVSRSGLAMPTKDRWASFGWRVIPTSVSGGSL